MILRTMWQSNKSLLFFFLPSSAESRKYSTRNIAVDWLRGFCAVWVVLFHLNEPVPFSPTIWRTFCVYGWLGVPIFFAISGYCIAAIALGHAKNLSAIQRVWRFLLSRLTRILIPFWGSLLIVVATVCVRVWYAGHNDVTVLPKSIPELMANLTLTTKPVTEIPAMNWVYWSLSYEVAFYILVAASLFFRRFDLVLSGVLVASAFLIYLFPHLIASPSFFWADKLPLFLIGFFVRHLADGQTRCSSLVGLLAASCCSFIFNNLVEVAAALLVIQITRLGSVQHSRKLGFAGRLMQAIGKQSFSVYLIHVPIGVYLVGRARPAGIVNYLVFYLIVSRLRFASLRRGCFLFW